MDGTWLSIKKLTLKQVTPFLEIYYHTTLQDPELSSANVALPQKFTWMTVWY